MDKREFITKVYNEMKKHRSPAAPGAHAKAYPPGTKKGNDLLSERHCLARFDSMKICSRIKHETTENYEQTALNSDTVGDALKFVKENEMCKVCSHNGNVFSVEPPLFVEQKPRPFQA